MTQWVELAKAVRKLGINRHELQKLIHDGELTTFEGKIDLDELQHCYPVLALEQSPIMEQVQLIKRSAFTRRVTQAVQPDLDDLESQLHRRNRDLGVAKARADKYHQIIRDLLDKLRAIGNDGSEEQREMVNHLNSWLLERLQR